MSKDNQNINGDSRPQGADSDSSDYLDRDGLRQTLDFEGLISPKFSNLSRLSDSSNSPTELFVATRYGKRFVVKSLKEQYRNDLVQNMAMSKEFEIGIRLDHPNIRRTIGFESVDGLGKCIILDYIDGQTLASLLSTGKISRYSARSIAAQIASALAYMHNKQMYHRDLKPSNILVSHQGGAVKLIDFNLSDSENFVILKKPAGTKMYIAPEQLCEGARPSVVADIYSFGVVLCELAEASSDEKLREIGTACTNPNPTKRPQSVGEIALPSEHPSAAEAISSFLSSKILTYILVTICAALTALIVCGLFLQN